jgi:hypothetical protein
MEALVEEGWMPILVPDGPTLSLGSHIVEVGSKPARLVRDLTVVAVLSQLNQEREGYIGCVESADAGRTPITGVGVGSPLTAAGASRPRLRNR